MCENSDRDELEPSYSPLGLSLSIGILLILSIFLRFFRIENQSLWVDEILTLGQSAIGRGWTEMYLLDNIHGPLQSVLMHLISFVDRSELVFRTPSAVFGVLTVLGMYWIGRQIGGQRMGLLASYFCAISPLGVWYSQEARNYSMCVFFTVIALGSFLTFVRRGSLGKLVGYACALALSLLSNLIAVFVAVGSQVVSLFAGKSRHGFWKVAAVHVLVAIMFIPWIIQAWGEWIEPRLEMPEAATPLRGETTFTPMAIPFAFYTFSVGFTLGPSLSELHVDRSREFLIGYWQEIIASVAVFGLVFLSGVFHLYSKNRGQFPVLSIWFLTPILLVSLLGVLNIKPFNTRYLLVAWPVYLIVLAAGVVGLRRNLAVFAVGAITALSCASLANHYFTEKYWKEDSRSAAEFIHEQTGPDSKIMAYSIVGPLRWYLPDREIIQIHPAQTAGDEVARETLSKHTSDATEFWLVTGRDWAADPDRRIRGLVDEMFVEDESRVFNGVEVSKYSRDVRVE